MARTPEGAVKELVKRVLRAYGAYAHMPVQMGYGAPSLDFIGCHEGRFFAIETKAPGKKLTERQRKTAQDMMRAGGAVFVVEGPDTLRLFEHWLQEQLPCPPLKDM